MSAPEEAFLRELRARGFSEPIREHRFSPPRRWRFDFCWPDKLLAVEYEGGTWVSGRHSRGKGFDADCEKYGTATVLGWRVLRITTTHIKSGVIWEWLTKLLQEIP